MDHLERPDLCHCFATRRSARAVSRLYDGYLSPAGINTSQFSILSVLKRRPERKVAELAEITVMERTTLVRALQPLQRMGFVESRPAVRGRASLLALTREGNAKVEEAEPLWMAAQEAFEKMVGADRARRLRSDNISIARDV